jgi:hypothetical protein
MILLSDYHVDRARCRLRVTPSRATTRLFQTREDRPEVGTTRYTRIENAESDSAPSQGHPVKAYYKAGEHDQTFSTGGLELRQGPELVPTTIP